MDTMLSHWPGRGGPLIGPNTVKNEPRTRAIRSFSSSDMGPGSGTPPIMCEIGSGSPPKTPLDLGHPLDEPILFDGRQPLRQHAHVLAPRRRVQQFPQRGVPPRAATDAVALFTDGLFDRRVADALTTVVLHVLLLGEFRCGRY